MSEDKPIENADNTAEKQQKVIGRPVIKGVSGNPDGRPKGSISITTELKKELEKIPEGQRMTYLEAFIKKVLKKAIVDEDPQMMKTLWSYIDGMPKQAVEHSGSLLSGLSEEEKQKLDKLLLGETIDENK
jgi:hypothetical protein